MRFALSLFALAAFHVSVSAYSPGHRLVTLHRFNIRKFASEKFRLQNPDKHIRRSNLDMKITTSNSEAKYFPDMVFAPGKRYYSASTS